MPPQAISLLGGEPWNDWATARALAAWLHDNPGNSVLLLYDQFHSGQMRSVLDAVLDSDDAARIRIRALSGPEFDDTNWWTLRSGYRAFGASWLMRFQTWLGGGDAPQSPQRNADDYRRDFLKSLAEKMP